MGERVDEIVDERAAGTANFAVFAADGINFPGHVAEERGDFVGVEAGGIDDAAGFDSFVLRILFIANTETDTDGAGARFEGDHFCALDDVRALAGGEAGVGAHEIFGGDDAGGGDVERGDAGDVRLAGTNLVGADEAQAFDTVLLVILFQRVQGGFFVRVSGYDEFSGVAEGDIVFGAELIHQAVAFDAEAGFEGIFRVVDAGVNDAAVARAGDHAELGILLDEENVAGALGDGVGDGAADYAAADDEDVGLVHGSEEEDLTTEFAESTEKTRKS